MLKRGYMRRAIISARKKTRKKTIMGSEGVKRRKKNLKYGQQ